MDPGSVGSGVVEAPRGPRAHSKNCYKLPKSGGICSHGTKCFSAIIWAEPFSRLDFQNYCVIALKCKVGVADVQIGKIVEDWTGVRKSCDEA